MNRPGLIILFAWLALTALYLNTLPAPSAWNDWPADYCRRKNCYCEPLYLDRLIAQPIATYSNLGFVSVGVFILWRTVRRAPIADNAFTNYKPYPIIYGLALTITGVFSFFYHASLTKLGDYLDLLGIYVFVSFLLVYNIQRLRPLKLTTFSGLYLIITVTLALALYFAYSLQHVYLAILIIATLSVEAFIQRAQRPPIDIRWLLAALTIFGLGAVVWQLGNTGPLPCWPSVPFTWHALWHLAAATAAGLIYIYYRSEHTKNKTDAVL
jgi:hypothetical protein